MPKRKLTLQFLPIFFVAFSAVPVLSQSFYVKAGGGYALSVGRTEIYSYIQRDYISPGTPELANLSEDPEKTEKLRTSYGKGGKAFVGVGYMFNNYLGLEVLGGRFWGTSLKPEYSFSNPDVSASIESRASMYTITSSLVLSTGREAGMNIYVKAGATVGIDPRVYTTGNFSTPGNKLIFSDELSEGTPFGISAALGINYPLGAKLALFGEIDLVSMSHKFGRRKYTELSFNGVNLLSLLNQTDFILLDRVTDDHGAAVDQTHAMPLSSWGVNVGVSYTIFGQKVLPRSR